MTLPRPHRGLTPTSCFVVLLLLLTPAWAEDPPKVVNEELGYTFTAAGLRRPPLNPQDLCVLRAFVDPKDEDQFEGSRLEIHLLKHGDPREDFGLVASGFVSGQGAKELERETVELAGRPATRVLLKHPDGRLILFLYENAKRREGAFAMLAHCRGEDPAARMKLVEKAIASFSTEVPEKPVEGVFIDRVNGFRIRLEGFAGRITGFRSMFLDMYSLRVGTDHLGTFILVASHRDPGETRAKRIPEIRRDLEKAGRKILSLEEVDLRGREAARIKVEYEEFDQRNVMEQLLVWEEGVVLAASIVYRPDLAKGREKPLLDALASFDLRDAR